MGILGWITLLPIAGALLLLTVPREETSIARGLGLGTALLTFLASLALPLGFDGAQGGFQLVTDIPWVASLGIHFKVGIDGISLWLVMLTTLLMPLTLLFPHSIGVRNVHVREFNIAMLLLEAGMLGAFVALDLFLFYVFWELMLVPMYLIIGIWGGERRLYASIKFVLYTLVGSLLMLAAILYVASAYHTLAGAWSFDYENLARVTLPERGQLFCFLAFALAFAIKVPLFPLHTWLPDAHVEAPTGGSVILAGVLLKFGTYGFIRFALPMFPLAAWELGPTIGWLAVIGIIFGALMAWVQDDVKKLVAYSSVSHLGFVVLGIFAMTPQGLSGAVYQMLAHGVSTGGLFLGVGLLYDRRHTRDLAEYGGLWARVPVFAALYLVIVLASVGLPGLCGFVGEFLILTGTFTAGSQWAEAGLPAFFAHPKLMALIAASAVILAAAYLLTMYQRLMFGPLHNPKNAAMRDVHGRETWVFGIVAVLALVMGLAPQLFLRSMDKSVATFIDGYKDRYADAARTPGAEAHLYPERESDKAADTAKPAVPPPTPPSPTPPAPPPGATPAAVQGGGVVVPEALRPVLRPPAGAQP